MCFHVGGGGVVFTLYGFAMKVSVYGILFFPYVRYDLSVDCMGAFVERISEIASPLVVQGRYLFHASFQPQSHLYGDLGYSRFPQLVFWLQSFLILPQLQHSSRDWYIGVPHCLFLPYASCARYNCCFLDALLHRRSRIIHLCISSVHFLYAPGRLLFVRFRSDLRPLFLIFPLMTSFRLVRVA